MKKSYTLAVLANHHKSDSFSDNNRVVRMTTITASSEKLIKQFADKIGAVICSWSIAK